MSRNRSFRTSLLSLALVALAALSGSTYADTVTPLGSLQGLIDLGHAGITVGQIHYYDFSYIGSPAPASLVPNPAPTAAQISVGAIMGADGGLSFNSVWESAEGFNQDSVIRFYLHVLNGAAVSRVNLDFNGAIPITGLLTNASVTETVATPGNDVIGQTTVFDDGRAKFYDHLKSSLDLSTPATDLFITKDVMVHTPVGLGGVATISVVDNRYHVVPVSLPAAAWGGMALVSLLAVGRVLRAASYVRVD